MTNPTDDRIIRRQRALANRAKARRSAITNGALLPPERKGGVDGRSTWVRRFHDLVGLHVTDLGGDDYVSTGELSTVRRIATLCVELERYELKFAKAGEASTFDLDCYQRASNTLRRLLETIGLKRVARDITDIVNYAKVSDDG